ncbi:translation initiation factor IF-3 [Candidatus Microgenomates bacterium]|nr:translation initiation factor IF-3 [Candidatus Microgenomates bacterium]
MSSKNLPWNINEYIRASELRVIGADDKQIGVLSKADALAKARELGLDLIEIAPGAVPPVAKIIELGKFKYQEEKKARAAAKKSKAAELKEIRFSPFIGEADYQTRFKRVREFLEGGDKVKLVVVFKGRQMGSKGFGYELFQKILKEFGDKVVVDMEPKFIGRHLAMIISPLKKKIVSDKKEETENKENA